MYHTPTQLSGSTGKPRMAFMVGTEMTTEAKHALTQSSSTFAFSSLGETRSIDGVRMNSSRFQLRGMRIRMRVRFSMGQT